jgi:hypothetical protein
MTAEATEEEFESIELPPKFTAKDRCDRCGAQAKALALLTEGILLLCGHHGREHKTALEDQGAQMEFED